MSMPKLIDTLNGSHEDEYQSGMIRKYNTIYERDGLFLLCFYSGDGILFFMARGYDVDKVS
jgi:hypothetical protein